jgi:hypothetical protein
LLSFGTLLLKVWVAGISGGLHRRPIILLDLVIFEDILEELDSI